MTQSKLRPSAPYSSWFINCKNFAIRLKTSRKLQTFFSACLLFFTNMHWVTKKRAKHYIVVAQELPGTRSSSSASGQCVKNILKKSGSTKIKMTFSNETNTLKINVTLIPAQSKSEFRCDRSQRLISILTCTSSLVKGNRIIPHVLMAYLDIPRDDLLITFCRCLITFSKLYKSHSLISGNMSVSFLKKILVPEKVLTNFSDRHPLWLFWHEQMSAPLRENQLNDFAFNYKCAKFHRRTKAVNCATCVAISAY